MRKIPNKNIKKEKKRIERFKDEINTTTLQTMLKHIFKKLNANDTRNLDTICTATKASNDIFRVYL